MTNPIQTPGELEQKIGVAMGLVYRESDGKWLMDVQPANAKWHMHDMTAEVKNVLALFSDLLTQVEAEVIGSDGDVHAKENPSWSEMRYDAAELGMNTLRAKQRKALATIRERMGI